MTTRGCVMANRRDWEVGFDLTSEEAPGARFVARPLGGPELYDLYRVGHNDGEVVYRVVRKCLFEWHDVPLLDDTFSTHDPGNRKLAPDWQYQLFPPQLVADILVQLTMRTRPTAAQVGNSSSPQNSGSSGDTSTVDAAQESVARSPAADPSVSSTTRGKLKKGKP